MRAMNVTQPTAGLQAGTDDIDMGTPSNYEPTDDYDLDIYGDDDLAKNEQGDSMLDDVPSDTAQMADASATRDEILVDADAPAEGDGIVADEDGMIDDETAVVHEPFVDAGGLRDNIIAASHSVPDVVVTDDAQPPSQAPEDVSQTTAEPETVKLRDTEATTNNTAQAVTANESGEGEELIDYSDEELEEVGPGYIGSAGLDAHQYTEQLSKSLEPQDSAVGDDNQTADTERQTEGHGPEQETVEEGSAAAELASEQAHQQESPESEPLHPVTLEFNGMRYPLFRSQHGDSTGMYVLNDDGVASKSLEELLKAVRFNLGSLVDSDEELMMEVPALNLYINEDSRNTSNYSFSQLLDVYVHLHELDGADKPGPLQLFLTKEPRFASRIDDLMKAIEEGRGYSTISFLRQSNYYNDSNDGQYRTTSEDNTQSGEFDQYPNGNGEEYYSGEDNPYQGSGNEEYYEGEDDQYQDPNNGEYDEGEEHQYEDEEYDQGDHYGQGNDGQSYHGDDSANYVNDEAAAAEADQEPRVDPTVVPEGDNTQQQTLTSAGGAGQGVPLAEEGWAGYEGSRPEEVHNASASGFPEGVEGSQQVGQDSADAHLESAGDVYEQHAADDFNLDLNPEELADPTRADDPQAADVQHAVECIGESSYSSTAQHEFIADTDDLGDNPLEDTGPEGRTDARYEQGADTAGGKANTPTQPQKYEDDFDVDIFSDLEDQQQPPANINLTALENPVEKTAPTFDDDYITYDEDEDDVPSIQPVVGEAQKSDTTLHGSSVLHESVTTKRAFGELNDGNGSDADAKKSRLQ